MYWSNVGIKLEVPRLKNINFRQVSALISSHSSKKERRLDVNIMKTFDENTNVNQVAIVSGWVQDLSRTWAVAVAKKKRGRVWWGVPPYFPWKRREVKGGVHLLLLGAPLLPLLALTYLHTHIHTLKGTSLVQMPKSVHTYFCAPPHQTCLGFFDEHFEFTLASALALKAVSHVCSNTTWL